MAVCDIMSTKLITVGKNETVAAMNKLFHQHPIHHLLVVDDGNLLGLVSDRDMLRTLSPFANTKVASKKDKFTLTRKAHQIMASKLVTIAPSAHIQDAARMLVEHNISLLPVVQEE
ncbi:MAG: acetoin utilization protein AcuB [Lentisphaeria bacterium]|jgi:acetoin utilization protein AcuB